MFHEEDDSIHGSKSWHKKEEQFRLRLAGSIVLVFTLISLLVTLLEVSKGGSSHLVRNNPSAGGIFPHRNARWFGKDDDGGSPPDLNECTLEVEDDCTENSSCQENESGIFVCVCLDGYTGEDCETDIDDCASNPCENGGTCTDAVNGYTCQCDATYTGDNCEFPTCAGNPCENGGTCTDAVNGYTCQCDAAHEGDNCEFIKCVCGQQRDPTSKMCTKDAAPISDTATLTVYYNFEGNFNDYPDAGDHDDTLTYQGNGVSLSSSVPEKAKCSTQSYAFVTVAANSTDPRVSTNFTSDITTTDMYTIMFWLKLDASAQELSSTRLATVRYDDSNNLAGPAGWQIEGLTFGGSGPDLRFVNGKLSGGNFISDDATGVLEGVNNNGNTTDDLWYHIAFVVSNSGHPSNDLAYMETFVDGVSKGTETNSLATNQDYLRNVNGRLILGGHNVIKRSATGSMDDFALFDGIVSDADIARVASGELSPSDFLD